MKRLFPCPLEQSAITLRQRQQIGVMPKPTDRKADYMCFSPLRRKTSELEGEEEYTSIGSFPRIYVIGDKIKLTRFVKVDDLIWLPNSAKKQ
jgi:hypothetical protein